MRSFVSFVSSAVPPFRNPAEEPRATRVASRRLFFPLARLRKNGRRSRFQFQRSRGSRSSSSSQASLGDVRFRFQRRRSSGVVFGRFPLVSEETFREASSADAMANASRRPLQFGFCPGRPERRTALCVAHLLSSRGRWGLLPPGRTDTHGAPWPISFPTAGRCSVSLLVRPLYCEFSDSGFPAGAHKGRFALFAFWVLAPGCLTIFRPFPP